MTMKHPETLLPDRVPAALLRKVPPYIRRAFGISLVLGLVTHLYMFTNKLPNHDDIGHLFSASYGTASGRWFLPAVLHWDGNYSMPWLIGVLSLLCLAVTVCLTVSLLRIRSPLATTVTSALLVAFPSLAATFSYLFTADAYCFGTLLAALGAYTAVRHRRWGVPLGVVAITLSMGIYQSNFPVAAVLMVGALIFETLDGEKTFRQLLLQGVRLAAVLALSMAAYFLMVRLTTRQSGLVDYMGISSMGQLSLAQIPALVVRCYRVYWDLFVGNSGGFHAAYGKYLMVLTALATVTLLVWILRPRRLGGLRTALAVVLILLYPLAGSLIYLMTAGMRVHSLMIYGLVFLPVAPVALMDYAAAGLRAPSVPRGAAKAVLSWVILISMALTAYGYVVLDNKAYLKLQLTYEQGAAYSNRLLSAVETCDGYERGLPVVLVGSSAYPGDLYPTPALNEVRLTGVLGLAELRTSYTYSYFLRYYLGFTDPVYLDGSDLATDLAETEAVAAMPVYPDDGSVQRIGDVIVVKLAETEEEP